MIIDIIATINIDINPTLLKGFFSISKYLSIIDNLLSTLFVALITILDDKV